MSKRTVSQIADFATQLITLQYFSNVNKDISRIKGSSDPDQFIFEINVGKSRIRHRRILKLNFQSDSHSIDDGFILNPSRSVSVPTLFDIDFENKTFWV